MPEEQLVSMFFHDFCDYFWARACMYLLDHNCAICQPPILVPFDQVSLGSAPSHKAIFIKAKIKYKCIWYATNTL